MILSLSQAGSSWAYGRGPSAVRSAARAEQRRYLRGREPARFCYAIPSVCTPTADQRVIQPDSTTNLDDESPALFLDGTLSFF